MDLLMSISLDIIRDQPVLESWKPVSTKNSERMETLSIRLGRYKHERETGAVQ